MALVEESKNSKTSWLKIGRIDYMSFVGNDVVAFAKGCFIVFYKISDDTEAFYMANSYDTGEGVQCFVGYQSAYMFAFAEMTPSPRIFLVTYPSFEHISVFQDEENIYSYLAMSFAEMECLVCLTGIPTFEIVVWSWRTGQKLASQPSNLFSTDQLIRCSVSMPIGVGQLSRYKNGSTLQLWEIHVCSKFCILHKTEIKNGLHSGTYVTAFCWSPEGIMYITDKEGNVYMIEEGSLMCKKVCAWPRLSPNQKMAPANLLWLKGGVVVSGPDGDVKFFKRSGKSNWAEMWVLYGKGPLVSMAVNRYRDMMVGWTEESIIYQVILEPIEELRQLNFYGHGFRLIEMIHPTDEYFATVDMNNDLCVWMKKSGELLESAQIDQSSLVLDMACNPEMPYLALARSDGALEIFAIYYGVPNSLNVLYLCNDQLSGVAFSSTGALIVTACYEIGRIFVTQGLVGTGRRMKVLEHLLTNKNIVNMVVSPDKSVPKLSILFNDGNVRKHSNELCVYSLPKLELMATINLPKWYSEIILNGNTYIGLPYLSRQIDIFNVNIAENTFNEIEEKESCHKLRKYQITGDQKHIVTYGWDGLVHVRDAETMVIFITFQPHHRIMKGVKRAVIDYKAKYVVTLGEEGNLVCTEILTNCGHSEKEHEKTTQFDETYFRRKTSVMGRETVLNNLTTQAEVNKITWLQEKQQELLDMERKAAAPELQLIKNEFSLLQRELVQLLNKNENAPPEQKLDILEFDLDEKNRNFLLNEAATERDNLRRLLEAEIKDCDRLFEVIKSNTWDKMKVKGRCIKAMLDDFKVENFPLLPVDPKFEEELKLVMERRKLVKEMSKEDHFEPWIPSSDTNEGLEESKTEEFNLNKGKQEESTSKEEKENPYVLFGSSSHQFVPISDLHCSQFEMGSLFNSSSSAYIKPMDMTQYSYIIVNTLQVW
uniref:Cilia- and flagella-associated protein 43 n=1 Tax=Clastoptera arizonana TaxID=38151 RepID=A0A1B6DY27_9HEMI